jgi:hypothetical protein
MSDTSERDAAVEAFSSRISGDDPHSAIAWADEIQDSESRRTAMIRAGRALMRQNAEEGRRVATKERDLRRTCGGRSKSSCLRSIYGAVLVLRTIR